MFTFPVPSHFPADIYAMVRTDPASFAEAWEARKSEYKFWGWVVYQMEAHEVTVTPDLFAEAVKIKLDAADAYQH